MHDFADRDLGHHRLPHNEVRTVFKQTTIVNNFTVVNNTVVNHGIPVDRVASATHREFHPAAVRDLPAQPGTVSTRFHATTDRNASVVYRTQLRPPPRAPAVAVQKVDDRHPIIQHTTIAPGRVDYRSSSGRATAHTRPPLREDMKHRLPKCRVSQPQLTAGLSNGLIPRRPLLGPPTSQSDSDNSRPYSAPPSAYRRDTAVTPNSSARSTIQRQPYAAQTDSRGGKPSSYYPKTYHQSAESRPMPQASSRHEAAPAPSPHSNSSDHNDHSSKRDR